MKPLYCLVLGGLAFLVPSAHAQLSLANELLDKASGTRIELRSVFDPIPPTGFAPVRAVITSGSSRDSTWTFDFHSQTQHYRQQNSQDSSFKVGVPANSTQSALFLVPVAVEYGDAHGYSYGSNLTVHVGAGGFGDRHYTEHRPRVKNFPAIAISPALADSSINKLNKEVQSRSSGGGSRTETFGSQFKLDDLPEDWLGLSGFDFIMLSHTEWAKLRPGVRRAIEQWVHFGGKLHLYATTGTQAASLGLTGGEETLKRPIGLGRISMFEWDGKELAITGTVSRYSGEPRREVDLIEGRTSIAVGTNHWDLIDQLTERSFASWQVILFLLVFGILVGPINLFVLAPSGRRHRLFITTPLLSIGASVLMIGVILIQDGTGGVGARFIAIEVDPAAATAHITQEQVSRTGVLLSGAFEIKQPALVEPVAMPDTPWVKLKADDKSQAAALRQSGPLRTGNYFQSRAEQGQILRAAISTRARLELKANASTPTLISALGCTLSEIYYIDKDGIAWKSAGPLATGAEAVLAKCEMSELRSTWKTNVTRSSTKLQKHLEEQTANLQRGHFFANAATAAPFTLDTLPSIRWQADQIALFGPVLAP